MTHGAMAVFLFQVYIAFSFLLVAVDLVLGKSLVTMAAQNEIFMDSYKAVASHAMAAIDLLLLFITGLSFLSLTGYRTSGLQYFS
jgi:hypothetical protein